MPDGEAEVFDAQVPGVNAFDANGLYVAQLRRAAAAALWRLPAGLDQSGEAGDAIRSRTTRRSTWTALGRARRAPPCACSTTSSTSRAFPCRSRKREAKAKRRIGLGVTGLADALIMCRARYGSHEAARADRALAEGACATPPMPPPPSSPREKGAFPLFDRDAYLARPNIVGAAAETSATRSPRHGIRNALLTSIAPTGTISLFADNVSSRHRAGVQLQLHPQRADARRHARSEEVTDHAYRLFRDLFGEATPLARLFRQRADAVARRPSGDAGGGAEIRRQLDLQDHQLPGRNLRSTRSRTSICRPMSRAARAAPPIGRTT